MEDTTPGTYTGHTLSHCARKGDAMEFSQVLRGFVNEVGCTGKELAEACGMSASTVSRYLAGTRTPDAETLPARELAEALCGLAMRAGRTLDAESVQAALLASARGAAPQGAGKKLSALLDTFGVTRAKLAEALGYSASYVSRVCAETRVPSDFAAFAEAAGVFFAERVEAAGAGAPEALAKLCGNIAGVGGDDTANSTATAQAGKGGGEGAVTSGDLARRICAWLCTADDAAQARGTGLEPFLHKLDRFDLDTYLAAMHAAQAMRLASAQQGPDRPEAAAPYRLYTGIDGFCQAELDFLARAAAEPAGTSVVMFSDMPMQDKMQAHPEFPAKWLAALAALLRGGHTIDNIHNVGRSLPEIMLGMEASGAPRVPRKVARGACGVVAGRAHHRQHPQRRAQPARDNAGHGGVVAALHDGHGAPLLPAHPGHRAVRPSRASVRVGGARGTGHRGRIRARRVRAFLRP